MGYFIGISHVNVSVTLAGKRLGGTADYQDRSKAHVEAAAWRS